MAPSKKKPASKPRTKAQAEQASGDPSKVPAPLGRTSGVGIHETWIQVFEKNEQVGEDERLTDEQIARFMKSEFPGVRSMTFDRVSIARGRYNRGAFHRKTRSGKVVRPKIRSRAAGVAGGPNAAARRSGGAAGPIAKRGGPVRYQKDFKSHKK